VGDLLGIGLNDRDRLGCSYLRSYSLGLNEGYGRGELQDGEALEPEEDDVDGNAEGIMVVSGEPYDDGDANGGADGDAMGLEITT